MDVYAESGVIRSVIELRAGIPEAKLDVESLDHLRVVRACSAMVLCATCCTRHHWRCPTDLMSLAGEGVQSRKDGTQGRLVAS